MWDRYPARPPPAPAPASATGSRVPQSMPRSSSMQHTQWTAAAGSGGSGGGAAATGAGQTATTGLQLAAARGPGTTTTTNTRSSSSTHASISTKKLTPPPQLHDRVLLKGQQYRQSQLQPQSHHLLQQSRRDAGDDSHLQQQTTHLRLNLRGGQGQGQGQGQQSEGTAGVRGGEGRGRETQAPGSARGEGGRRNFPYSNSNRGAPNSFSSTSTLHHQNHWPDDFRNPREGLGIEHNLPSPPDTKSTNIESEDTIDELLLPPPSLARHNRDTSGNWRPASSIYSDGRDSYTSPVTPNFANVAARNTYSSAVADISPPSSPEMEAHHDGPPAQDRNVSPMQDSPDMSQLSIADHPGHSSTPSPNHKSSIPMMRRERRKNQDAAAAAAHTLRETKSQQRLRIQRETRWDDMTGEPTSLNTGRAGQVRPQEYAQEFGHDQPFGKSPAALKAMQNAPQTQPQSFGDRLKRLRPLGASKQQRPESNTAPDAIQERPPWRGASGLRGASGRTAIVNPVRDTAPEVPLDPPRRSSRRMAVGPRLPIAGVTSPLSPVSPSKSETSPRSKTPTARTVLNAPRQLTATPSPAPSPVLSPAAYPADTRTPPPAQSSYPSPPNSGADVQSPVLATPEPNKDVPNKDIPNKDVPVTTRQPASLSGLPAAPNAHLGHDKAIRRKPPPANSQALHAPQPSYSSSVYSQATVPAPIAHEQSPPRVRQPHPEVVKSNEPWVQPPSRFSVTTYATSAPDTPRESTETARPPVPALPTPPQTDGVMNRKRPAVLGQRRSNNADEPIVISMSSPYMTSAFPEETSPTPARSLLPSQKQPMPRTSNASLYSSTSSRPDSVWSTSKALPPPPTELSMVNDRVGYLNARLESLGNRRININQAIKQMTELMPTDSILASEAVLRKREAEKRKVEALKVELAEVQREEYEIGLKLHRAYKRMDRNAEYEPTTLWVRRVTG